MNQPADYHAQQPRPGYSFVSAPTIQYVCSRCQATVYLMDGHTRWHEALDEMLKLIAESGVEKVEVALP